MSDLIFKLIVKFIEVATICLTGIFICALIFSTCFLALVLYGHYVHPKILNITSKIKL